MDNILIIRVTPVHNVIYLVHHAYKLLHIVQNVKQVIYFSMANASTNVQTITFKLIITANNVKTSAKHAYV